MSAWLPLLPLLLTAAGYRVGVTRLVRRGDRWPRRRAAAMALALSCLGAATLPPVSVRADEFPVHVAQHLLLASAARLLLAISGPVTLALRTLPPRPRKLLLAAVHSHVSAVLLHPVVVLVLNVGALYALYLTRAFAIVEHHRVLHAAVHLHMLAAGCLLSWYLIGVDPLPRRASVRQRLLVLLVAAGAHDVLAKYLYAHFLPAGGGDPAGLRAGAQLLFYGGDLVEVLLSVALLTTWYARTGRELNRDVRRVHATAVRPAAGTRTDRSP